jgi:hypothetical protein
MRTQIKHICLLTWCSIMPLLVFAQVDNTGIPVHFVYPSTGERFQGKRYEIIVGDTIYVLKRDRFFSTSVNLSTQESSPVISSGRVIYDLKLTSDTERYFLVTQTGRYPFRKIELQELTSAEYLQMLGSPKIRSGKRARSIYPYSKPLIYLD